jgi:cytosine/adenosine deaminase-related metal-dependent hydrolase
VSRTLRARWVLPIDRPPIDGGRVTVIDGRITEVAKGKPADAAEDLGDVALLPGLVNAHTHLELSWMRGRIPPAASMDEWMQAVLRLRRDGPPGGEAERDAAMARGAVEMRAAGTVLAGDVSNTLASPRALAEAGIGGVVFHELLGFNAADPVRLVREAWERVTQAANGLAARPEAAGDTPRITFGVVAHAPYSVSPAFITEIARSADATPLSIHLAESPEEMEFLRTGHGPIRATLEALGVWTSTWRVPACDPVTYVADLGYLQPGVLVVHGVHLTDDAVERLRRAGAVLVTCPRSNEWVGAGLPRLSHFYAARLPVAIGTDSLASAATLSVFDELADARRIAPDVAPGALLESATRIGAAALGRAHEYGTLAPGKRAAFAVVQVPAGVHDVEEYLVGGVPPAAVRVVTEA